MPLLLPVLLSLSQVSADERSDQESLANERFPVNSQRIEAQWGVDCGAALEEVRIVADAMGMATGGLVSGHSKLRETLQLCGFIYNTPGSGLYRSCPDYKQWQTWLAQKIRMPGSCQ